MKVLGRIFLSMFAIFVGYRAGLYAESYTMAPLASGGFEGTPATFPVFLGVFLFVLLGVLVLGSVLLNRYFRSRTR
jgi:hypothetical protein